MTLKDLSFAYRSRQLFSNINAELQPGFIHYLAGPNGSGKSTLLKLLSGFLVPSAGEILLDHRPLTEVSSSFRARNMGVLFQTVNTAMDFTVQEMIYITASARFQRLGRISSSDRQLLADAMEKFGINDLSDRAVNNLSGGERQRTLLAGLAALSPQILLLDEPTSALDPAHRNQVMNFLENYAQDHAVLIVTHDLELLSRANGQVWLLDAKSKFHSGSAAEMLNETLLTKIYNTPCTVEMRPNGKKRISFD